MTGRQALDRAAQRVTGIDLRLMGNWDPLPTEVRAAAREIADLCKVSPWMVEHSQSIGDLAAAIGDRLYGTAGEAAFAPIP